jgi:hypothetical protein
MNLHKLADNARDLKGTFRVPALPPTPTVRAPRRGETSTDLANLRPLSQMPTVDVVNQPAMKVVGRPDGSAVVSIRRNTRFIGMVEDSDLAGLEKVAKAIMDDMVRQSQGPLTTRMLRRMGHPYGRNARGRMRGKLGNIGKVHGIRGSVPNLAVINRQSANGLASQWRHEIKRDAGGVTIEFINEAPYAAYLALGTRKMQAHGPFTNAPLRRIGQINAQWNAAIRKATRRKANEFGIEHAVARSLRIGT